jgi:hypothetical protein
VDHLSVAPEKPAQLVSPRPALAPNDQVRALNYDDLHRRRVTVFFRFFMALPHLLWLSIWSGGVLLLAPVLWIATLVNRRPPEGLREVYAMFVRYATHVYAFLFLAAQPFPGFLGRPGTCTVDLEVPPTGDQGRWGVGFRFFLALPPLLLATALVGFGGGGGGTSTSTGDESANLALNLGVGFTAAFFAWWACMARGRMPQGIRDLLVYAIGYAAQAYAYLFLLTSRYPNSDPAVAPLAPLPPHPVRLRLTDELRRSRWTVAFRLILSLPHLVWVTLWTVLIVLLAIAAWLVTLIAARPPRWMHRFFARYVRYQAHVVAFAYLGGGPFPGFVGAPGSYPVDIEIGERERHNRWTVLGRALLGLPAAAISSGVGTAMVIAAIGGWFFALITGRMPQGLRNLIAYGARYGAQVVAYYLFVTPRYPYSGPADFHR